MMTSLFNSLSHSCASSKGSQNSYLGFDRRLTVGSPSLDYRSKLLRLVSVLTILLPIGVGDVWADSSYTLGWGTASGSNYTNFTTTSGTVTNIVSFTTAQNDAGSPPAYNSTNNDLRLYYNSDGNGGSITLTPAAGKVITGFVMTTTTAPDVKYSVDGGSATSVSVSSNTYTVTGISAYTSVTMQNVNTTNTQLRIKTIQISYTNAPSYSVTWLVNGANWNTGHGSPTTSVYAGQKVTALPTEPTSAACDNSKVFVGWTNSAYSHATDAPTVLFKTASASPTVSANTTYYAVFATATAASKTVTYPISSLDNFGTPTGTAPAGSSASIDETYTTTKQMTDGNSQTVTLTGWGTTNITNITLSMKSNKSSGAGKLSYSTNSGSTYSYIVGSSSEGVAFNNSAWYGAWSQDYVDVSKTVNITGVANNTIKIKIEATVKSIYCESYSFTYSGYNYSNYATTCCTPLASINGSVSWTNGSKATLLWDKMSNVDATTPYTITYRTGSAAYGNTNVSAIRDTISNTKKTCTITGLTAGTSYDFKIAVTAASNYCDKDSVMTATAPLITASATLTGSDYAYGSGPGMEKSFTVSGVGLTGDITVTAPTNFEVSTTSGESYSSSVVLSPSDGTLSSTTVYIRLAAGKAEDDYEGDVTISGGGAANNTSVSIAGTVSEACSVPSIGNPTLTSITSSTITVSCPTISGGTNCDVDDYGFIWKAGSAPTMASYDGKKQTGTNNQSSSYSDGLSITVTTGTTYHIKAYAHNSAGNNVSSTALQVTPQKVTFNSNGGSDVADKYVNYNTSVSAPGSSPTKAGYDFDSWRTTSGLTTEMNFSGAIVKDTTLYAKWNPASYDVTLKANGGTSSDQVVSATYTQAMPGTVKAGTDIVAPTYNGYTFGGYYDNADYSLGTQYYTNTLASAHVWDKTSAANLYGRWTANEYTVTLDANGGTLGATTSVNTTFGQAMPTIAAANLPTREGYRFDGFWTDQTSGTQYYYANGTSAKNQARYSADQKLYAHWQALTYFSVNGDIVLTIDDGDEMPGSGDVDVPTECGNCWAFAGWSEDPDEDSGIDYASGATHTFGEPDTLYAVFGQAKYERITSTSGLVANDYYVITMIASDDHEYALTSTPQATYPNDAAVTDVTDNAQKNSSGWFLYNITAVNRWKFTGTSSSGQLYNEKNSKYLNLSSTSNPILNASSNNLTFTTSTSNRWTINSTYYLRLYSLSSIPSGFDANASGSKLYIYHRTSITFSTTPSCEAYDIVWKVGGTPTSAGDPTDETTTCTGIETLPTNPDNDALGCATQFMGWSERELVGLGHDAPADLFTTVRNAPKIDEDKTFYAVFATTIGTSVDPIEDTSFSSKDEDGSYCNSTFSFKSTGKYLQQQSIWTSSSIANVTVKIRVYHMSNSVADVLRVSLINSDGSEVVGKDLTTTKTGSDITSKGDWSDVVELTPTSAVTGYKVSLKTKNSSGVAINKIERELVASGAKDYVTICCDKSITIGTPSITGSGTVTFTLGGEDLDPGDDVETCTSAKDVVATVTPAAGYSCTAVSFTGVTVSIDPTPESGNYPAAPSTQDYTLSFAKNTTSGTLATSATFEAKALEGWSWKYKKDADVADGSVDPYAIPDVVEIYKDQYARFIITGYAPADVIAEKQGYVYSAGGVEPAYSTDYLTWVANTASYFTLKGKNPVESTTITFKAIGDASVTRTMTIRVKALPLVHFVDNVHNVAFDDVVATVTTGVVTLTKKTPTQDDFVGTTKNTCEETHLHLVGWIDGDWSPYQAYMDGTGEKPAVSAIIGATGYFYAPNVDIDLVAKDGKTFYAVWANVE